MWLSFAIAGVMSTAPGYTLVKFGQRYPSSGGLVVYLLYGFRSRRLVGVTAWLGYLTAIIVITAMVAISFGDYAAALFFHSEPGGAVSKACAVVVIVAARWLVDAASIRPPGSASQRPLRRRHILAAEPPLADERGGSPRLP